MKKVTVAVLAGGWSSEREVSLSSGRTVAENLPRDRYEVRLYDPMTELGKLIEEKN